MGTGGGLIMDRIRKSPHPQFAMKKWRCPRCSAVEYSLFQPTCRGNRSPAHVRFHLWHYKMVEVEIDD